MQRRYFPAVPEPPRTSHPFLDHPGPIPFAHRGGAAEAAENTMTAFQAAVDLGYRYIETDAQATKDGQVLAFHDADLVRTTGRPGKVADLTWDEVRTATIANVEPIPLLEDVLRTWPDLRVNVDAKSDDTVQPLIDLLRRADAIERVCVGSFRDRRISRMRDALGPGVCTSTGPIGTLRWRLASSVPGRPLMPATPCAQVPLRYYGVPLVTARTVAAAHAEGMQVHVWTIDDAEEMRRLLDLGVDGIMTDRPKVLKAVLAERGQWFS
jgi:glycerophosphoryl diester phosphodiesterase